jgi:hypothetical protein
MHTRSQYKLLTTCVIVLLGHAARAQQQPSAADGLPAPFSANAFREHAEYLSSDELAGRAPGSEGSAKAAEYIIRHFKACGLASLQNSGSWFQEFPLEKPDPSSGGVTAKNILAVLPGRGALQREAVIICAHYDHLGTMPARAAAGEDRIYNGADDNASGVAAFLLVAKACADEKNTLPASHRTIIFASFDAEEQGLLGARYYVDRPAWPLDETAAVINLDAMGRMRLEQFFASDAETNPMLAQAVRDAATERHLIAETRIGGHGRSDHCVFIERRIPAVHFFTGANSDYHQVSDEADRLNFDGGANIAWVASTVLRKIIENPEPIEFRKLDPKYDVATALNFVQTLGIVPNVNAQQGRYPEILLVIPNSSAAKGGLKAGDQITAINGLAFNRVEDGLVIFEQLTFDDGLRLSILRGNENTEVHIPASAFDAMLDLKTADPKNNKREAKSP